jgi:hypothetical protein
MFHLPEPTRLAILSLVLGAIAFVVQLAQRLGDWRSRAVAAILALVGFVLLSLWIYLASLWLFWVDLRVMFTTHGTRFWIVAGTVSLLIAGYLAVSAKGDIVGIFKRKDRKDRKPSKGPSGLEGERRERGLLWMQGNYFGRNGKGGVRVGSQTDVVAKDNII